jgi:L-ornithine N5-oxygenase
MPKEPSLSANVERFAENREAREFYDVVGIGFGPSNLAVAATIQEESEGGAMPALRSLFLESKPRYAWHPDMLLQGAQVQLTFLKDLVTLRNPQSRFTFLNYLRDKGRLNKFVNLRNFYPTRIEFNDYYCWVAQQLADQVRYSRRVLSVSPLTTGDSPRIELLQVKAENTLTGAREEYLCRNLIVATGGVPRLPRELEVPGDDRIFHSHQFLSRIESRYPDHDAPHRFVVVGSGQSSAEIFHYLMSSYPNAQVTAALRRFAYKPADDSDFVNEIFFPHMVSFLYGLPESRRRAILREHNDTNYSAVDLDLIKLIYQALYERMIVGDDRLAIRSFLEIRGLRTTGGAVIAEFFNSATEGLELVEADGIILATGYEREKRHPLLCELDPYLVANATGYCVQRDYRLLTQPAFAPGIFFQGFCEDTHGLSDTLLSVLPARSYEIFQALLGNQIEQIEQIETELSEVSAKGAP